MLLGIGLMFIDVRLGHQRSICSVDFAISKYSIAAGSHLPGASFGHARPWRNANRVSMFRCR
jgi:hypothetical protein